MNASNHNTMFLGNIKLEGLVYLLPLYEGPKLGDNSLLGKSGSPKFMERRLFQPRRQNYTRRG
jgi:hypothetical protein